MIQVKNALGVKKNSSKTYSMAIFGREGQNRICFAMRIPPKHGLYETDQKDEKSFAIMD